MFWSLKPALRAFSGLELPGGGGQCRGGEAGLLARRPVRSELASTSHRLAAPFVRCLGRKDEGELWGKKTKTPALVRKVEFRLRVTQSQRTCACEGWLHRLSGIRGDVQPAAKELTSIV